MKQKIFRSILAPLVVIALGVPLIANADYEIGHDVGEMWTKGGATMYGFAGWSSTDSLGDYWLRGFRITLVGEPYCLADPYTLVEVACSQQEGPLPLASSTLNPLTGESYAEMSDAYLYHFWGLCFAANHGGMFANMSAPGQLLEIWYGMSSNPGCYYH